MSNFFAMLDRMKYIERWSLMRSVRKENIMEHSQEVAVIAHALAVIGNTFFDKNYDENKIAVIALFHETSEVLTGDLPTPIKYYNSQIKEAYKALESVAEQKLISMLPKEMIPTYENILSASGEEHMLMKQADKISAYIKCLEELKSGNNEFIKAEQTIREQLENSSCKETKYFMENFIEGFKLTLDELDKD